MKIYLSLVLLFFSKNLFSQNNLSPYFFNISTGAQISGIKDEDFVFSNVSPLIDISLSKWFSDQIGFGAGYRGPYFKLITDDIIYRYDYFYADTFFNLSNIFFNNLNNSIIFSFGPGFFYQHVYERPNVCVKFSLSYNKKINSNLSLQSGLSSIIGWDIYQGNDDILPAIHFGIVYQFNKNKIF